MSTPPSTKPARPLPVVSAAAASPPAAVEELRTSNEVNGFEYSRLRGIWFVSLILIGLPLFPLWPFFIAWEAGDWSIARNYFRTLAYVVRTILVHISHGSFVRLLKYNIVLGPEEVQRRISARRGACTRCAKCCKQYECIYLGQDEQTKDYYCKVYQTHYWYYGTCGRYPIDQVDIDDHGCPGFYFDESPA